MIIPKMVAVSGYFDPLHKGHCEYFKLARKLVGPYGIVVCILNNDKQALLKKSKVFMKQEERKKILDCIKYIDKVYISIDDDSSVCKSLEAIRPDIFAKGGDRNSKEIPESNICHELGIKVVDGLGKKIQSSSYLTKTWEDKK